MYMLLIRTKNKVGNKKIFSAKVLLNTFYLPIFNIFCYKLGVLNV